MTKSSSQAGESVAVDLLVRSDEDMALRASQTRRSSKWVRLMRLVLPVVALSIVVVLMVWSDHEAPLKPVPREEISPQTVSRNELVNPKFQSEDNDAQPYTITADKATQNADDMDMILLDKPVADMSLKSGNWVAVKADQGAYNQKSGLLRLNGSVQVHHDTGYELRSEHLDMDIDEQTLQSDRAVTGHGPAAEITAQGLEADGKTDTLTFKGPAKLILRQVTEQQKK